MVGLLRKLFDLRRSPILQALGLVLSVDAALRVAIAEDVIAQLEAKKLKASKGVYLEPSVDLEQGCLQEQLLDVKCEVCALGACFAVAVGQHNEFEVEQPGRHAISGDAMREHLTQYFSKPQLWLVEAAFEKHHSFCTEGQYNHLTQSEIKTEYLRPGITLDQMHATVAFGKGYDTDHNRMRAIMLNIIANKGEFKPC